MKNLNWWLIKIERISAWLLLVTVFLYILSGYGMTRGIIDIENARWLHLKFLPILILITFTGHVSLALRLTFIRWQIWNKFTKTLLVIVFGAYLIVFGHFELDYQKTQEQIQNIEEKTDATVTAQTSVTEQTTEKTFTLEELATYNGLNGTPAYAAVDGVVYDLSRVFRNGRHEGHAAGQDLTEVFYSVHMKEILSKYPIVGKLAN